MSAGYSGTSLVKKLSLKPNMAILALDLPPDVRRLIEAGVTGISWFANANEVEAALIFVTRLAELSKSLTQVRRALRPAGFIWVCWPKMPQVCPPMSARIEYGS